MTTNKFETAGSPVVPEGPDINSVIDLAHLGLERIRESYTPGNTHYLPMRFSPHTAPIEEPAEQVPSAPPVASAQPAHAHAVHRGVPVSPPESGVDGTAVYEPVTGWRPSTTPNVPSLDELAVSIYGSRGLSDRFKNTLRHASHGLRERIVQNRRKVVAGVAAVVVLGSGAIIVKSLQTKDETPLAAAGAVSNTNAAQPNETKPSAPINLKTTLTAKNILGTTPVSVVGVNASGTEKVVYSDLDGKEHEITTFNGQQLSWSIAQGFEYYGVPETSKAELFTVTKEDDVTVITVDLKNYDLEVDPTFAPGYVNPDNTKDQFAMNLFAPGANVPVGPKNLDPAVYIALQAFTTDMWRTLKPEEQKKLDPSKYVSPQEWVKIDKNYQMFTAAKPVTIIALQTELLSRVQAGTCGADTVATMRQALADNINKNISEVLQRTGQDVSKYRIDVVGDLKIDAFERLQKSDFGKLFQSALQAKNQFLQFNVGQLACTVTPVSTTK